MFWPGQDILLIKVRTLKPVIWMLWTGQNVLGLVIQPTGDRTLTPELLDTDMAQ